MTESDDTMTPFERLAVLKGLADLRRLVEDFAARAGAPQPVAFVRLGDGSLVNPAHVAHAERTPDGLVLRLAAPGGLLPPTVAVPGGDAERVLGALGGLARTSRPYRPGNAHGGDR
jgi:hypothetical protein